MDNIQANTPEEVTPGLEPFIEGFFEDRKKDLAELKSQIQTENYDSARKIAHNWKGFCEPYGFGQLGVLAAELEKVLTVKDEQSVHQLVDQIDWYFANKKLPIV